jgi:hypothetical protein
MRTLAIMTAATIVFSVTAFSTAPSEAARRQQQQVWVPSNVSHDVCQRRLNRGLECLYPYWYPYGYPDLAYRRYYRYWSFWPWW